MKAMQAQARRIASFSISWLADQVPMNCTNYLTVCNPSIWEKNSVFNLLDASCSESIPLEHTSASTSSKNTTEGVQNRAASNKHRTIFSDSPRYFEIRDEDEHEKKVLALNEQTAFANRVFPVPGGPKRSTPYDFEDKHS